MDLEYDHFEHTEKENSTEELDEYSADRTYLALVFVCICVIGLITNGTLVYILRKTDTSNKILLYNLAASDLLVVLSYLPFNATFYANLSYPHIEAVCSVSESVYAVYTGVTALTLIALGVHSQLDATTPTLRWTQRNGVVVVVAIWTLAVVLATPTMKMAHLYHAGDGLSWCLSYNFDYFAIMMIAKFVVYVAVPLVFFACLYFMSRQNGIARIQTQEQKDFSKQVIVLNAVFAVCFVPISLIDFFMLIGYYYKFWYIVDYSVLCLCFAYRCLNPLALYCTSGVLRKLFRQHVLGVCMPGNRFPEPETREPAPDDEVPLQSFETSKC